MKASSPAKASKQARSTAPVSPATCKECHIRPIAPGAKHLCAACISVVERERDQLIEQLAQLEQRKGDQKCAPDYSALRRHGVKLIAPATSSRLSEDTERLLVELASRKVEPDEAERLCPAEPEPWLVLSGNLSATVQQLAGDLESANNRLREGMNKRNWWSRSNSPIHLEENGREFTNHLTDWKESVKRGLDDRFQQLVEADTGGVEPKQAEALIRSVLNRYADPFQVLRSAKGFLFVDDTTLPPGIGDSEWESIEKLANRLQEEISAHLDGLLREVQIKQGVNASERLSDVLSQAIRKYDRAGIEKKLGEKRWTVYRWAKESEVDNHTAQSFLKGTTKSSVLTRQKLAKSLGLTLDQFPD